MTVTRSPGPKHISQTIYASFFLVYMLSTIPDVPFWGKNQIYLFIAISMETDCDCTEVTRSNVEIPSIDASFQEYSSSVFYIIYILSITQSLFSTHKDPGLQYIYSSRAT